MDFCIDIDLLVSRSLAETYDAYTEIQYMRLVSR